MSDDASKQLTVPPTPPPEGDGSGSGKVEFERAKSVTVGTAQYIATGFSPLDTPQRLKLVEAFRSALIPRRAPGRKRRKEITAACADWKLGMKGLPLYRKHIPSYDKLAQWRRRERSRALMDAIRTRERRNKSDCQAMENEACSGDKIAATAQTPCTLNSAPP